MRETATSSHESGAELNGLITIPDSESEAIFLSVSSDVMVDVAIAVGCGVGGVSVSTSSKSRGNYVIPISPQTAVATQVRTPIYIGPSHPASHFPSHGATFAVQHRRHLPSPSAPVTTTVGGARTGPLSRGKHRRPKLRRAPRSLTFTTNGSNSFSYPRRRAPPVHSRLSSTRKLTRAVRSSPPCPSPPHDPSSPTSSAIPTSPNPTAPPPTTPTPMTPYSTPSLNHQPRVTQAPRSSRPR
ncbi:hypothetical protein V499_08254 [Pseudogymnoascus sp. VKM F-103]|nr:hypothetical protein V499_08254 [Pseudogymnoascus sp. VKM F-103]